MIFPLYTNTRPSPWTEGRGHEAARLDPQWPFIDGDARHNGQPKFSFREQQQQKLGKPALAEAQVNEAGRQAGQQRPLLPEHAGGPEATHSTILL